LNFFGETAGSRSSTARETGPSGRYRQYRCRTESTDNRLAIEVLKDIADEDRLHAGEFLRLLYELAPDEGALYGEGASEVEEKIGELQTAQYKAMDR